MNERTSVETERERSNADTRQNNSESQSSFASQSAESGSRSSESASSATSAQAATESTEINEQGIEDITSTLSEMSLRRVKITKRWCDSARPRTCFSRAEVVLSLWYEDARKADDLPEDFRNWLDENGIDVARTGPVQAAQPAARPRR